MTNKNPIDTKKYVLTNTEPRKPVVADSNFEKEQLRALKLENDICEANKKTRNILIWVLTGLSISWLYFTGYEIRQIAKFHHYLPASVAIAFITTSLGTVVGLWAIGLNYFFYNHKK